MREINVTDIQNIRIGQVEHKEAGTGVTVFISEQGCPVGCDVRGGGPAGRETELLKPLANAQFIHAVVLGGGSAYGLEAGSGVMEYLEQQNIGYDVGIAKVPLVCQSNLFDLSVGDPAIRPDKERGYQACVASEAGNYRDGNYGAGCGATVGKMYGMDTCMKAGIGSYAVQIGQLQVGAVVAVNALGDIYDPETGKKIAGLLTEDKKGFRDTCQEMYKTYEVVENKFTGNTTIGVILTNAKFNKVQLCKIASMGHNGYARAIRPVHTSADGDTIYALSTEQIDADQDMVGTLAADVMAKAIVNAIKHAQSAYGHPAYKEES